MKPTLTVTGKLPSLNDVIGACRTHPHAGASLKKRTEADIMVQIPRGLKVAGRCSWHFVWYEPTKRRDPDNIASAVKFLFDALVCKRVIENDGWAQVAAISHEFRAGKNQRVEIFATPLDR